MMDVRGRTPLVAAVCVISLAIAAAAQETPRPPSPTLGEVVLLSTASGADVAEKLTAALRSSDPGVRRAAGRIIAVVPHGELRRDLIGALAREQDADAGAEFVRDLLHLTGASDAAIVEQQAKRLGGSAVLSLAEWLARTRPAQFAERLPGLVTLADDDVSGLDDLVVTSALQNPAAANAVLRGWMGIVRADAWDRALSSFYAIEEIEAADSLLLEDALGSPRADVREETVWFVLQRVIDKEPVPKRVVQTAGRAHDGASSWEAFGRELIARGTKPPASGDRHEVIAVEGAKHQLNLHRIQSAPQLTAAERDAIQALGPLIRAPSEPARKSIALTRTLPVLTPGMIRATFDAAKCRPGSARQMDASVAYASDGAPLRIVVNAAGLSAECATAWSALARTVVADDREPAAADPPQTIVLPLTESFLACADAPPDPPRPAASPDARRSITQPSKVKNVRPEYPEEAQRRRIEGVVVVDATISGRGCVSSARVLRSLPYLDLPAVSAVAGWEFTPTLLDGVAVPVRMTVSVNFALK